MALSLVPSSVMAQTAPGNPSLPPNPPPNTAAPPAPAPTPPTTTTGYAPMPPPAATTTDLAPPPESEGAGVHEHDGFYARFGLGTSGYTDTLVSDKHTLPTGGEEKIEGVLTGFATVSEVALGGTIGRGFVLGVGIWSTTALTLTYTDTKGPFPPAEFLQPENFGLIGPFFDWYFNANRGLHLQLGLGFATLNGLNPESPRLRDRDTAIGGGMMLGFGYEWWAGKQWGIGVLGRLTAGVVTEEDDAGVQWTHIPVAFPSMLFTATYN